MGVDLDIMVPAFGDGPLIRETVGSVLGQTDGDWRLTVIDDDACRSGLGLRAWLAGQRDSRIQYFANAERIGINRNFQRCADESRADWVTVLGADDRLLPDFVARVRDAAAFTPYASWIHTGASIIEDSGRPAMPMVDRVKRRYTPPIRGRRVMAGEELAISLLNGNWMYFPSCTFRRDVLQAKGFGAGYQIVLDLDLYLRILLDGGACVLFERPGIEYRRHASSLSSARADDGSRFDEEIAFFDRMAAIMAEAGWHAAAAASRRHWMSRLHAVAKIPSLLAARKHRAAASMVRVAFAQPKRGASLPDAAQLGDLSVATASAR